MNAAPDKKLQFGENPPRRMRLQFNLSELLVLVLTCAAMQNKMIAFDPNPGLWTAIE